MQSTCVALGDSTGALSHLVEAATALAKLQVPVAAPKLPTCQPKVTETVSIEKAPPSIPRLPTKREIFPQRLLAILSDSTLSDVVAWLPHGRSFVIIRPDVFTEKVLPKYLPAVDARASTKYPSFTRKLNRWGFRQATRGPDTGAFHHPLFRRDKPDLCLEMVCQRSRDRTKKVPSEAKEITTAASTSDKLASAAVVPTVPLTKESLAAMSPPCSKEERKTTAPTVVSDDSVSVKSTSNASDLSLTASPTAQHHQLFPPPLLQAGVSNNKKFVQSALRQRDEVERLKVAKAMLYQSYVNALRGE